MSADDVPLDDVCHFCLGDLCKWLVFHRFGEVVDGDAGVFVLSWCSRELANDVHDPFGEGSWNDDAALQSRRLSWDVGEALELVAALCPLACIFHHGRPEITLLECFEREGDSNRVVPADSIVDFAEDLGRLGTIEGSEQWR